MTKKMHMFGNSDTTVTFFLVESRARQIQNLAFIGPPFEKALALIYREALSNEVKKWQQPGLN